MDLMSVSSGELSASAQVFVGRCYVTGAQLMPPSAGTATLKIYDSENSTTTGKVVLAEIACQTAGINGSYESGPIIAQRGIYCVLTGTASTYTTQFSPA